MLTKEKILEALRKIRDPELHKSLVELDLIEDLRIDGNHVAATVVLVKPRSPHKSKLRDQITTELKALEQVQQRSSFGAWNRRSRRP